MTGSIVSISVGLCHIKDWPSQQFWPHYMMVLFYLFAGILCFTDGVIVGDFASRPTRRAADAPRHLHPSWRPEPAGLDSLERIGCDDAGDLPVLRDHCTVDWQHVIGRRVLPGILGTIASLLSEAKNLVGRGKGEILRFAQNDGIPG